MTTDARRKRIAWCRRVAKVMPNGDLYIEIADTLERIDALESELDASLSIGDDHSARQLYLAARRLNSQYEERIDALEKALQDMFALIEEGYLVRNTADDAQPGFALRQLPYVRRLATNQEALTPERKP